MRSEGKRYPSEFREKAVQLVQDSGESIYKVAKDLEVSYETLWR